MKKGIAVPYIIALILGIAVVGLIGYWFFFLSKGVPEEACKTRLRSYCTEWSGTGYDSAVKPGGQDFDAWAPGCAQYDWAGTVDQAYCETVLGVITTTTSGP